MYEPCCCNCCRVCILCSKEEAEQEEETRRSPRFKEQKDKVDLLSVQLVFLAGNCVLTCLCEFSGTVFTRRLLISWPRCLWRFLQWLRNCLRICLEWATRSHRRSDSKRWSKILTSEDGSASLSSVVLNCDMWFSCDVWYQLMVGCVVCPDSVSCCGV